MDHIVEPLDWNLARAFLMVAKLGSLSKAARALGQTKPTLGRQIARFEEEIGLLLFDRVGRALILTKAGQDLLPHAEKMESAARGMQITAAARKNSLAGEITITASELMTVFFLAPLLGELREKMPKLTIRLQASDRIEDLRRREADIAIRHVRPEEPELIARKLADFHANAYATQSYFGTRGQPQNLDALNLESFVGTLDVTQAIEYLRAFGLLLDAQNFPIRSNSDTTNLEIVLNGHGIGFLPNQIAKRYPQLEAVKVMPEISVSTWLVAHRELYTNQAMRLVFDLLAERLQKAL